MELEWSKRIELIVLLKELQVKTKILEIFFCVSLRFRNAQVITKGIEKIAVALHNDFPMVCERICSAGGSGVKRLVDDPEALLESLSIVASALGQKLETVWSTVCSAGGSGVKRLVDDPEALLGSLSIVASALGQKLETVWSTVCSAGRTAIGRLVDDPFHFLDALESVAAVIEISAWYVFLLFTGSQIWCMLIDEPVAISGILSSTPIDNYALVKLVGTASVNFWRSTEVRGAAQAHLTLQTPWAKIKTILSRKGVYTKDKFDTAIFELTPEDTSMIYTKRVVKTKRRRSSEIEKEHACNVCPKCYGSAKALTLHIKTKHS